MCKITEVPRLYHEARLSRRKIASGLRLSRDVVPFRLMSATWRKSAGIGGRDGRIAPEWVAAFEGNGWLTLTGIRTISAMCDPGWCL